MTTDPGPITPGKPVDPATSSGPQREGKQFDAYMQRDGEQGLKSERTTPMELAQGTPPTGAPPTMDSIQTQARVAQDGLGQVEQQLKEPQLKLKRHQVHLLKNKLSQAQEQIRSAGQKLGIQAPPFKPPAGSSALGRFISYVNDGQDQLIQVQNQLKQMASKGQQLNAADMLSVTVKMNLAQQEIEYSTTLLGKVMDSIKQVMNIQL